MAQPDSESRQSASNVIAAKPRAPAATGLPIVAVSSPEPFTGSLEWLERQHEILALVVGGTPLPDTLQTLLRTIESQADGMLCSILLMDEDGLHVRHGAAPSLPESYVRAIDGSSIGPVAGSCGTAAYRHEPVIVEDIATDPLWVPYRDLALAHGLRACWSTPIIDGETRVIGTFALYFRSPARPSDWHRRLIELTTSTAALAIIHERERQSLVRREAQLAEAQRVALLGSYEWYVRTNEVRRSEELCRIFGVAPEQFPPTFEAYLERVHPADRDQTRATVTESVRSITPFDFEERIVRGDGEIRWLRSQGHWIGAPHDPTLKLVGICQDITDRKRIEEESRRAEALRVRNDELRAFAYMVSHDLRAPLRAVAGYARELDRQHASGANTRADKCVTEILAATSDLEQLIEDLLRYCRIEGEVPAQTDVSLETVVAQVVRQRWPPIGPETEVSTDFEVTHVRVWERGLVQILANLVDNAVKFSADATPPRVRVSSRAVKDVVRVAVADNGIGFDMKYHDRIFGLFHRLDAEDRFEGTGAGLAIVKKMADRMGAVVHAESVPGAGATFMVDLPRPRRQADV